MTKTSNIGIANTAINSNGISPLDVKNFRIKNRNTSAKTNEPASPKNKVFGFLFKNPNPTANAQVNTPIFLKIKFSLFV